MLQKLIKSYAIRWANDLLMERTIGIATKNSLAFSDISKFGEVLCSLLTGMYGKGGGGSGHDLSNGRFAAEVKTVCWCQSWECKTCNKKTPWTSTKCIHCDSVELRRIKDSRAGIKAKTHIKYADVLKEYYIVLIDWVLGDEYVVKVWEIDSANPYFETYIKNQAENGSQDTCNMIPGAYDFHMSSPKLIYDVKLWLDNEPRFETRTHDKIEDVPVSILNKEEKEKFPGCVFIPYEEACAKLGLRKKNLGKPRGETSRCL